MADVSIVFRALNEEKWFDDALEACKQQRLDDDLKMEIILVDSGSTDRTMDIADSHGCRIVHIPKSKFTFGRSLNWGCEVATGKYLVLISAHCIPDHDRWLQNLIQPLIDGRAHYTYGRQIGHEVSKFSEKRLFAKHFPDFDMIPQEGYFCNNANSAILKSVWEDYGFDEEVTGLEDMVLGRAIVQDGLRVGYVSSAPVIHIHEESMPQVRKRYYREALTLRDIMPEVHVTPLDAVRYFSVGVFHDLVAAARQGSFFKHFGEIVGFRYQQFLGTYEGHNEHRRLSRAQKEAYFYPEPRRCRENLARPAPPVAVREETRKPQEAA